MQRLSEHIFFNYTFSYQLKVSDSQTAILKTCEPSSTYKCTLKETNYVIFFKSIVTFLSSQTFSNMQPFFQPILSISFTFPNAFILNQITTLQIWEQVGFSHKTVHNAEGVGGSGTQRRPIFAMGSPGRIIWPCSPILPVSPPKILTAEESRVCTGLWQL